MVVVSLNSRLESDEEGIAEGVPRALSMAARARRPPPSEYACIRESVVSRTAVEQAWHV